MAIRRAVVGTGAGATHRDVVLASPAFCTPPAQPRFRQRAAQRRTVCRTLLLPRSRSRSAASAGCATDQVARTTGTLGDPESRATAFRCRSDAAVQPRARLRCHEHLPQGSCRSSSCRWRPCATRIAEAGSYRAAGDGRVLGREGDLWLLGLAHHRVSDNAIVPGGPLLRARRRRGRRACGQMRPNREA